MMALVIETTSPVMDQRRFEARTCLLVNFTPPLDYCSIGHDESSILWWWWDGAEIETASGNEIHDDLLGGYEQAQDYIRGRYDNATGVISLLRDINSTDLSRRIFRVLEIEFPKAIEVLIY